MSAEEERASLSSGQFVLKRSMRAEMYILVSMSRFSVDIEGEFAGGAFRDADIQHVDDSVSFLLFRPFDVRVKAVDECEESVGVILVDGDQSVIRFTQPEEDGAAVLKGRKGILLEVFHEDVGKGAGGGFSHAQSSRLRVVFAIKTEICQVDVKP